MLVYSKLHSKSFDYQYKFTLNQLPHVLGLDTKIIIQTQKYSEQEQRQQLGVAENGEVGDKVLH